MLIAANHVNDSHIKQHYQQKVERLYRNINFYSQVAFTIYYIFSKMSVCPSVYGKLSKLRLHCFTDFDQILHEASLGPRECSNGLRSSISGRGGEKWGV